MVHFSETIAIKDPNADKHIDVLPPIKYNKIFKTFDYEINGESIAAKDLFIGETDDILRERIIRMGTTEGSTGKRDFCFI